MIDDEIAALERRIRGGDNGEKAWAELDAALLRSGLPPRRVWHVFASRGEYADKSETTWPPFFWLKRDAVAFMDRLARDRDWESWERSLNDEAEPEYFCNEVGGGRMYVQWAELVPPGEEALTRCGFRHQSGDPECQRPANHA